MARDTSEREAAAAAASQIRQIAARVKENIGLVIVGKDEVIDLVLVAMLSDGHILFEDVPGLGKTTLASNPPRATSSQK